MALRPFRLQSEIALARLALAQTGDEMAVDGQLENAVVRLDTVMVPLVGALAVVLGRQATGPTVGMRPIRDTRRPPDAEEIALTGGANLALLVLVGEIHQNLHLDAARVPTPDSRDRIGLNKEAAVADRARRGWHVHPVELRDEVLVLLRGPQIARRLARCDNLPVLDKEGAGGAIDVDPAAQALAVEQRREAFLVDRPGDIGERRRGNGHAQQQGNDAVEKSHDDS